MIDRKSFDAGRNDLGDELAAALDEHRDAHGNVPPEMALAIVTEVLADLGAIEVCRFCDHQHASIADTCPHCGNPTWHDLQTCPCDDCDEIRRDDPDLIPVPRLRLMR